MVDKVIFLLSVSALIAVSLSAPTYRYQGQQDYGYQRQQDYRYQGQRNHRYQGQQGYINQGKQDYASTQSDYEALYNYLNNALSQVIMWLIHNTVEIFWALIITQPVFKNICGYHCDCFFH